MKVIRCRDVGVDCDFEAHGATVNEVLGKCQEHALKDHGMQEIPPELRARVMDAIQDESMAAGAD